MSREREVPALISAGCCDDAARIRSYLDYDPLTGCMTIAAKGKGLITGRVIGSLSDRGYLTYRGACLNRQTGVHRLAWLHFYGQWPRHEIDHINGLKTDNRISNLRDVPRELNAQNRNAASSRSTTGYLGVVLRYGRYSAAIRVNGRAKRLGSFETPEEASAVYYAAKAQLHPGFVAPMAKVKT